MTLRTRYTLFVLISAAAAAAGLILTEIALRFFAVTSLLIAFLSNAVGGLTLLIPIMVRRSGSCRGWPATDWLRLIAAALAMYAAGFLLLYAGIDYIGSAKSVLLGRLEVIFVIGLAVLFLGERWTRRHWLASLLALGGAVLVNFDAGAWQLRLGVGEFLILLASFVFAVGMVTLKPLLDRRDGQLVTGLGLSLGALFLAPFLYGSSPDGGTALAMSSSIPAPSPASALGLIALSVLALRGVLLAVSWATYNIAMRHIGASRCSVLFLSVVIFIAVLQVIIDAFAPWLGLKLPENLLTAVAGGFIIAFAIILIHRDT